MQWFGTIVSASTLVVADGLQKPVKVSILVSFYLVTLTDGTRTIRNDYFAFLK